MALTESVPAVAHTSSLGARGAVRWWLIAVAGLIFLMVLVGGATRLTELGLSITQWKPVTGILPPLSGAEWQAEFDRYKQIPQFAELNPDMTLAGFKTIFWWEWSHRLLARVIGAAFVIPGLWFWRSGLLKGALGRQVAVATGLLALEPIVGWWMVTSGLKRAHRGRAGAAGAAPHDRRRDVRRPHLRRDRPWRTPAARRGAARLQGRGARARGARLLPARPRRPGRGPARRPNLQYLAVDGIELDPGRSVQAELAASHARRPGDGAVRSSDARLCRARLRASSSPRRASLRAWLAARAPRRHSCRRGHGFRSRWALRRSSSSCPSRLRSRIRRWLSRSSASRSPI